MRLKHLQSALSSVPVNQFPTPNVTLEQYATSPTLTSHVIHAAYSNDDIGPGLSVCDLGCGTGMLSIGCALVGSTCVLCVDCDSDALSIARDNIMDMELEATVDDDGSIDEEGCRFEFILSKVKHVPDIRSNQQSNRRDGKRRGGNKRNKAAGGRGHRTIGNSHEVSEVNDQNHKMKMTRNGDDGIPLRSKCVDTVMTNPPFGTKPGNAGIDVTFLRTATRLAKRYGENFSYFIID